MPDAVNEISVIGGGPAGYVAAIRAAQLGAQVTLIENDTIGGTCINRGCIPTKTLLQSGNIYSAVKAASAFGVSVEKASLDFSAVTERKQAVVQQLVLGVESLLRKNQIRVIKGMGTIVNPHKVRTVGSSDEIRADKIIIASGSVNAPIHVKGADGEGVIDSDQFLAMEQLPKSMVIIGGGVIGVEFAQILHRMGTMVTLIEITPRILPGVDAEIAQMLEHLMKEDGIEIHTNAVVSSIGSSKEGAKKVTFSAGDEEKEKTADRVLMTVGRRPYVGELGLEKLGMALDRGRVIVNERMETSIAGIYATGDVVGGIMLAHVAMAEGKCAALNAMGLGSEVDYRGAPRCIYTSPEIAEVGLTEQEAQEEYDNVEVGRFPFWASGKALILGETRGLVKLVAERKYGQVLGVQIIGPNATDLIAEAVLGMRLEATYEDFASTIHAHPTLSEAVMEAALGVEDKSIHV